MSTLVQRRKAIAEIVKNWQLNTKVSFAEMRRRMGRYLKLSDPYPQRSFTRRFRNSGKHLNTDYPLEDVLALIKSVCIDIPKGGKPCTIEEVVKLFSLTGNTSPILIPYPNDDKPNPYIQEIEAIFSPTGLLRLRMQFLQQWGLSLSGLDADQANSFSHFQIPDAPKPYKFVGRETELEKLSTLVRKHERVSIHGMAGIGKSYLAKQFARQTNDFSAIFWVSIGEWPLLAQILLKMARDIYPNFAFDASEFSLQHQVQRLFSQFVVQNCEKPFLVILDDVWTGPSLQVTYQLLEMFSHFETRIILTTRFHQVTRTLHCEALTIAGLAKFTKAGSRFRPIGLVETQYIQ